jgi:hypothetical protein
MNRSIRLVPLMSVLLMSLGCATSSHWAVSGGDRENGIVRVSYEYPEFEEPTLSEAAAAKLALSRCSGWGYESAELIPGQLRQCSNKDDGDCDLWKVTREYQCRTDLSFAGSLAK